ncbi:hypothetical protein [Enterococcus sp. AZ196]|uniref:hypothetical protein n=1 Tax=Enterococcus sp. AZ196 TaxID=2774659 RepID=UPI003D2AAE52
MHFITEQELQLKYRQGKLKTIMLTDEERLTPGAKQFLNDHQVPLVSSDTLSLSGEVTNDTSAEMTLANRRETFFLLLEVELWEAAVKAHDVHSASCERIACLAQSIRVIMTEDFPELVFPEVEDCEETVLDEITKAEVFCPGGKVILKLRRAIIQATALQTCVTSEQKLALEQSIDLIKTEICLLGKL